MLKNVLVMLLLFYCAQACTDTPTPRPALVNLERLDSLKTISQQQAEDLVRTYLRDTLLNAKIRVDLTREMFWVDTSLILEPLRSLKYIVSEDTTTYIAEEEGAYMRLNHFSNSKIQVYEPIYEKKTLIMQTFRPALDTTRLALWLGFANDYFLFLKMGDNWDVYMQIYRSGFSDFSVKNGYIYKIQARPTRDGNMLNIIETEYTFSADFRDLHPIKSALQNQR
jgi:hypothetical protein